MTGPLRIIHPARSPWGMVILAALVYLGVLSMFEKQGFWVIDNSNKFLQLQAIIENGYTDYSIPWDGAAVDPELVSNPMPHPFSQVRDGRIYSIFSPVFAVVSSIPYRFFGFPGLYIVPWLGGLLALAALVKIIHGPMGGKLPAVNLAVFIAGICTPMWFYSCAFWEHTPAVALCMWSLYFLFQYLRRGEISQLVLCGVLAMFGVYFRDELYLFCGVLAVLAVLYGPEAKGKTALVIAGAMIVTAVPLWLFQGWAIGAPFGFHLGSHLLSASGMAEHLSQRPQVVYNLLIMSTPNVIGSVLVSLPFLVFFFWNPGLPKKNFLVMVPVLAGIGLVSASFSLWGYVFADSPGMWMYKSNGLFSTVPILLPGLVRLRETKDTIRQPSPQRLIHMLALGYAVIYCLAAPELGSTGIHWGNRFLLVLYPILSIPAAVNLIKWYGFSKRPGGRLTHYLVIAVILMTFTAQANAVRLLHLKKQFSHRVNREMAVRPEEVIIANYWWIPQEIYSQYHTKLLFYAENSSEFNRLTTLLREKGYGRFLFATIRPDEQSQNAVVNVDDTGLNLFSLKFFYGDVSKTGGNRPGQ